MTIFWSGVNPEPGEIFLQFDGEDDLRAVDDLAQVVLVEPRLADLGLYVGFDTYVEFHLRGVEPGAELQADRQCADDFAVDVQRVSGICRAFRIELSASMSTTSLPRSILPRS